MLSLYLPDGDPKALFSNATPHTHGVSGREASYTDAHIALLDTYYRRVAWGARQISGDQQDY